jgi:hypothetical protein
MDVTKILTASIVVLLAAGGAVAGTGVDSLAVTDGTNSVSNANVYATTDNNTVELTLVDEADGVGVANATVEVERHYEQASDDEDGAHESVHVGTTDENGTIAFELVPGDETRNVTAIEVEFTKGTFAGEVTYRVGNDSLSVTEEEYEYERDQESENDAEDEHENENRDDSETGETDDDRMSVGMSDAREIADAALESPSDGRWVLVEADAHEEDRYYEFEYVLADGDHPGEAELRIHGSTGEVIDYEQEIEFEEPEDETEDDEYESEDETDDDDDDADEDDDDERGDD